MNFAAASERELLFEILNRQEKLMALVDDLNTAVTNISAAVTAAVSDIQVLTAQIAAANSGTDPDAPAIQDAVTKLNALADSLQAAITPPPAAAAA